MILPIKFSRFSGFELKLNYELRSPGINWIMGDNGSGKSTLLKIICGVKPHPPYQVSPNFHLGSSECSFLGSGSGYFAQLSVKAHFKLVSHALKLPWSQTVLWLRYWQLENLIRRKFDQLSLGQRSRALLALYTLGHPRFIAIDEPEQGLDEAGQTLLIEAIKEWRHQNHTLIICTHTAPGISRNDWITVLSEGSSIFQGNVKALLSSKPHQINGPITYLKRHLKTAL